MTSEKENSVNFFLYHKTKTLNQRIRGKPKAKPLCHVHISYESIRYVLMISPAEQSLLIL